MAKTNKMLAIFEDVDKMNEYASILSESSLSLVDEWIDTGSMALNAICSGSMYKGVPQGRIIGLAGPSMCGKTFIMNQIIGNFQKGDPERMAAVWDSEIAEDANSARSVGADPDRIKHYPIDSILHMRNQILAFLNSIKKAGAQGKFIIGIDSLGNLGSDKEINDAVQNKDASDMGLRAKEIKSMLRVLTYAAAATKTTIVFTNHIYANPTAMYDTVIKQQSGGKGPQYMASLLLQMAVSASENDEKNEKDVMLVGARKYSGSNLRVITAKNRFIPQFLETEMYLNFKTGLDKYSGLFELAKAFGVLEGDRSYSLDGEKIGYYTNWRHDEKIWNIILPRLEKKINESWRFGTSDHDVLKKQVDAISAGADVADEIEVGA